MFDDCELIYYKNICEIKDNYINGLIDKKEYEQRIKTETLKRIEALKAENIFLELQIEHNKNLQKIKPAIFGYNFRVIDLSKIIKIRKFDNAVVFYEQDTYHVCEPNTELPSKSEGYIEVMLKRRNTRNDNNG